MFENVKQFLVDELRVKAEDVTLEAELAGDLGISSIDFADLIITCETEFDIEIDDEATDKLVTVGDVVDYLESL